MVAPAGILYLFGPLQGNLDNQGRLFANQYCDDETTGQCVASVTGRIGGDFQQSATASIRLTLGMPLQISGTAALGGSVELVAKRVDHFSAYILPGDGSRQAILHADGGVSGQFAQWLSRGSWGDAPGIFLQGNLAYGPNDVYFDVVRASLQATMSTAGAPAPIIKSAATLDQVFARSDAWAVQPANELTGAQRRFLASAASLQHIAGLPQANASLASVSGRDQADALLRLAAGVPDATTAVDMRLDRMRPGGIAGAWWTNSGAGTTVGVDRWIGESVLLGSTVGASTTLMRGAGAAPALAAYTRWFGSDGWYASGFAGFEAGELSLSRAIDLGPAGRFPAYSTRHVQVTSLRGELGRVFPLGGGKVAPFLSVDASDVRSERFSELGGTGFELAMAPSRRVWLDADAGLRYSRTWASPSSWLRLDAAAGYRRGLWQAGSLQARYLGFPDLGFDVPELGTTGAAWLSLGLRGGEQHGWNWALDRRASTRWRNGESPWQLKLQRDF